MGYCSAPNCSNKTSPSMKLYKFPADPERRKKWLINCRRDNWIPRGACLCQVHFDENQFEQKRLDQLRKLKPCAVPTIFAEGSTQKRMCEKTRKRNSKKKKLEQKIKSEDGDKEVSKPIINDINVKATNVADIDRNIQNGKIVLTNGISQVVLDCDMFNDNNINIKKEHCEPIENVFLIENEAIKVEKNEECFIERNVRYTCDDLNQLKMENETLKKTIKSLEKFLHKDQLEYLTKDTEETVNKWSKECITTCFKLKSKLGWNGYNYLLSMGYPGPSRNTLRRHLKKYPVENSAPEGI